MIRKENRDETAVSEIIGFMYIFAIVILSMSMIYVSGVPILQKSMDDSVFESTEQSFFVLQSNMKMVGFDQVPMKTLNIQLQGATFSVSQNSNLTINYDGNSIFYDTGEIEYKKNDRVLTYENGGIWKRYPDGNIMVSSPRIYTGDINGTNITTIGIVHAHGDSFSSGNSISFIKMEHNQSSIINPSNPVNLTIRINSIYAQDWKKFLENLDFTTVENTGSSITVIKNNTLIILGMHQVDVNII